MSEQDKDTNPVTSLDNMVNDPRNKVSEEEANIRKGLTSSTSVVKTSLIQLLMSDFNKVSQLDDLSSAVVSKLIGEVDNLDPDTLIELLRRVNDASSAKTKSIYELFQKQGNDVERILEELRKLDNKSYASPTTNTDNSTSLTEEKREKVLTIMANMSKNAEDVDGS
jgi:hypothetical protein